MFLGALLDLGLSQRQLDRDLAGLGVEYKLRVKRVVRGALSARYVEVLVPSARSHARGHGRSYRQLRALLKKAKLAAPVRARALAIFEALAVAEGRVHGVAPDEVHFHEVGAVDAIVDITWAVELTEEQNILFYDQEKGGFYMTASGHDDNLLVRMKGDSDNVEPSAASVATLNLLRLSQFTDREDFLQIAEKTLTLFGAQMKRYSRSLPQMLVALDYYFSKPQQIIIAGDLEAPCTQEMLKAVHQRFIPNKILIVLGDAESQKAVSRYLPLVEGFARIDDKATAYVCVNYTCALPTNDVVMMNEILDNKPR